MLKLRHTPIIFRNCSHYSTTIISKKFAEIPYHEQYESRDFEPCSFDVSINTSNIPDNLTKPKYISSELNNIINSKYAKKVLKEITKTNENKTDRNSPW
mgnify:FL=1|jgi:hypothetical protein